jgi:creatinine amidohydrolase
MMMSLEPELVDTRDLASCKGSSDLSFIKAGRSAYRWRSLSHVTSNGVIGDPTYASKEKGNELLKAASLSVSELIINQDTFDFQQDLRTTVEPK